MGDANECLLLFIYFSLPLWTLVLVEFTIQHLAFFVVPSFDGSNGTCIKRQISQKPFDPKLFCGHELLLLRRMLRYDMLYLVLVIEFSWAFK